MPRAGVLAGLLLAAGAATAVGRDLPAGPLTVPGQNPAPGGAGAEVGDPLTGGSGGRRDGEGASPALADPLPFDHVLHSVTFERTGLGCLDCHPVGGSPAAGAEDGLPPPLASCHACHLREVEGAPRRATDRCETCHPYRDELIPVDHGPGWIREHGPEARALRNGCDACHDVGQCVDCHDARGAMAADPHPAAFRSLHGIQARLDPSACSGCHAGETCVACHVDGRAPW